MTAGIKANVDGSAAIQVGGTDVITLTSGGAATFVTSPTTVQAGTAAAPSITFSGDTNTGIYSPGADQVAIATGGSKRFEIDATGDAGLGVTPSINSISGAGYRSFEIGVQPGYGLFGGGLEIYNWCNTYYDGAFKYANSSRGASWYFQSNGQHQWFSAPSGTAGNNITSTQVLAVNLNTTLALQGGATVAGTGITFPAAQNASSDANTLDDYEEGVWTPILTFGGVAGVSTYSQQNGTWTKIGNTVTVRGFFAITTKSAATGTARITGLPFATRAGTEHYHTAYIYMSNQSITGAPMCYINPNDSVVQLGQSNGSSGFASLSNTNFLNNGDFIFQATYLTN